MTITVCVLVPDGMVLAADSRQVSGSSHQPRVTSDNAEKLFQLGPALATSAYGQGFFYANGSDSPRSIGAILHSEAKRLPSDCMVEQVAISLHRGVSDALEKHRSASHAESGGLAFHVAGYDPNSDVGQLYRCEVPGEVTLERTTSNAGAVWSGDREIINRLVLGYDARLIEAAEPWQNSHEPEGIIRQRLLRLQLNFGFQTMPLQDAVDLAVCLNNSAEIVYNERLFDTNDKRGR